MAGIAKNYGRARFISALSFNRLFPEHRNFIKNFARGSGAG